MIRYKDLKEDLKRLDSSASEIKVNITTPFKKLEKNRIANFGIKIGKLALYKLKIASLKRRLRMKN